MKSEVNKSDTIKKIEEVLPLLNEQLAHNALSGVDDKQILNQLFESIKDIHLKLASGLDSAAVKVSYASVNFRVAGFKEVVLTFVPEDLKDFDEFNEQVENMVREMTVRSNQEVRVVERKDYDGFMRALMRIKKVQNVKNNGVAMSWLLEKAGEILSMEKKKLEDEVQQGESIGSPNDSF